MLKPISSTATASVSEPKINTEASLLADLIKGMTGKQENHSFLRAHQLDDMSVNALAAQAQVGPTQSDNSAAMVIYGPEKHATNMLAMVADTTGVYEDVLIPGVRIPRKLDTCSAANWTPVPDQTGHLFQAKLDTLGATARG